jgi:hypothetical protein
MFLAPRMSQALFTLHRQLIHSCEAAGKSSLITDQLLPDRWAPHCTLVGQLTPTQVLTAVEACQNIWTPIHGYAVGIGMRLWPTVDDHRFYALGPHDDAEWGLSTR